MQKKKKTVTALCSMFCYRRPPNVKCSKSTKSGVPKPPGWGPVLGHVSFGTGPHRKNTNFHFCFFVFFFPKFTSLHICFCFFFLLTNIQQKMTFDLINIFHYCGFHLSNNSNVANVTSLTFTVLCAANSLAEISSFYTRTWSVD